jgi:hypothetical protein
VQFDPHGPRGELVSHIRNRWFIPRAWERNVHLDDTKFAPHTARAMTGRLAHVLDRCAASAGAANA